jgi:hypothetical protein
MIEPFKAIGCPSQSKTRNLETTELVSSENSESLTSICRILIHLVSRLTRLPQCDIPSAMKSIVHEVILSCFFVGWLYPTNAEAIASYPPSVVEPTETEPKPCLKVLAGPKDHPLALTAPAHPGQATALPLEIQALPPPSSAKSSGYFDSLPSLNNFIDENGIALWVAEAKVGNGANRKAPPHFLILIRDYRASVRYIFSNKSLDEAEIFKILYYNISSVSSGVIPVEWAHENSEVSHFLTDQLEFLRDLLGDVVIHYFEHYEKFDHFENLDYRENPQLSRTEKDFLETFQNVISPLLHPRFGVRIVFQTCHLLYDLMLEQKYFQVVKEKVEPSLHSLLQDTLLRTGTHPYVLLYFWEKEPRLLMDQDFPADGFWFRRSGVFKNPPRSKGRLRTLIAGTQSLKSGLFDWRKYDRFDPNFVLSFGSVAKYAEFQPPTGGPKTNLLKYIKLNLEVSHAWELARAFNASKEYFGYKLESTGPWSETVTGHASALSLFLLGAGHHERLLQFDMRISTDISAEDFEFLQYVTSRNSPLDRGNGNEPSRTRRLMLNILNFLTFPLSLPHVGTLEKQSPEPLQLEQDLADKEAASTRFETPALPNLGAALNRDIFTTDEIPSQLEIQKLGTTYKQLAHEIECIYEWVMNVEFGVGNVIDYNRSWREIVSMINPNHLDQMIKRLSHDLALLEDIQSRMTFSSADSKEKEEEEALVVEKINKIFAQSNINLIQFTKSLIEDLEVIQHTTSMHHPSNLVPANADDLKVSTEMGRISQNLRKLPALLQRSSTAHSHR